MSRNHWLAGLAVLMLMAAPTMSQQRDLHVWQPGDAPDTVLIGDPLLPSQYWLGIQCSPVPLALRSHLSLPEKQGLLVTRISKNSPADAAGLAPFDILLRADGKPLAEPRDLLAMVDAAKETKLKIELIRGGKPLTIELTPAKRPDQLQGVQLQGPNQADLDTIQKWMESMMPGQQSGGPGQPFHFRIVGPGAIVPQNAFVQQPLPMNLSVAITKEGNQPAKIIVKRDNDKWELTEKDLDKLPADIRPHVEQMLGRGMFGIVGGSASSAGMIQTQPLPGGFDQQQIEKRFEEMNHRMDKLFKMMQEMDEHQTRPTTPEHRTEK